MCMVLWIINDHIFIIAIHISNTLFQKSISTSSFFSWSITLIELLFTLVQDVVFTYKLLIILGETKC